mgnify:CR=1 FL=1
MATPDIFEQVIQFLEHKKRCGLESVELDASTRAALFADSGSNMRENNIPIPQRSCETGAKPAADRQAHRRGNSSASVATAANPVRDQAPDSAADTAKKGVVVSEADPRNWDELMEAIQSCTRCGLCKSRTHAVFGEGAIDAAVMFIGEGPGYHEDQSGRPFVGRAGELLTKMIKAMQFRREDVFITNIVKCRPPANRDPQDNEAAACLPYLNRQIDIVQPQIIVLLGAVPLYYLLGRRGITRIHGNFYQYRGITVLPTYHPSFVSRSTQRKAEAWEDLQKVMKRVGKDPEETMRRMRRAGAVNE